MLNHGECDILCSFHNLKWGSEGLILWWKIASLHKASKSSRTHAREPRSICLWIKQPQSWVSDSRTISWWGDRAASILLSPSHGLLALSYKASKALKHISFNNLGKIFPVVSEFCTFPSESKTINTPTCHQQEPQQRYSKLRSWKPALETIIESWNTM